MKKEEDGRSNMESIAPEEANRYPGDSALVMGDMPAPRLYRQFQSGLVYPAVRRGPPSQWGEEDVETRHALSLSGSSHWL